MKLLTTNFVKCAVKACDSSADSFPLKYEDVQLVQEEQDFNPEFIANMLERLDWAALLKVAADLGNTSLPSHKPDDVDPTLTENEPLLRDLHSLLLETQITEGKMVCGNCQHVYHIKNSIPNFLLPPHLA
ncbi:hypothetical protein BABINDRAFT_161423 [Babjeviella inositovora NRRL Y-12698]|uniref:Multifunctional methyltransferase subunit trm112 n=1 Tax=Babjeviella inositovora NRRL Y-12698 TaxID=984486 RepID=A0A1E3QPX6_9ASCO|nr:uncharacterized protein BABINDRAFT_161423 [Babjeviella inositovora NRRL Y-12698]ODQ79710.1 hypothetical protein BABINDRAFT_161423 [Babjeviella inositovora NRRL Y-12698]